MTTEKNKKNLKAFWLYAFGLVLTFIGGPVASPFLKVFFKQYGARAYFLSYVVFCSAMAVVSPAIGLMMLAFVFSVFIYGVLEKRGVSFFTTAALATFLPPTLIVALVFLAVKGQWELVSESIFSAIETTKEIMSQSGIKSGNVDTDTVVHLFPGVILSFFVIGVGSAVALERKAHVFFGFHYEKYASQLKPLEVRFPDGLIWVTLISMAMAVAGQLTVFKGMGDSETLARVGIVGQNLCMILSTIYFFQGLAILEVFLGVLRAGMLTRFFAYFTLVLNLVLVLSAIGFVDYWLDFRKRLRRQVEKQRRMI